MDFRLNIQFQKPVEGESNIDFNCELDLGLAVGVLGPAAAFGPSEQGPSSTLTFLAGVFNPKEYRLNVQ